MFLFSHDVDQKTQEESWDLPPFSPDNLVLFSVPAQWGCIYNANTDSTVSCVALDNLLWKQQTKEKNENLNISSQSSATFNCFENQFQYFGTKSMI